MAFGIGSSVSLSYVFLPKMHICHCIVAYTTCSCTTVPSCFFCTFRVARIAKSVAVLLVIVGCFITFVYMSAILPDRAFDVASYVPIKSLLSNSTQMPNVTRSDLPRMVTTREKTAGGNLTKDFQVASGPCKERLPKDLKVWDKDLPLTAIASPWRSGNTWVRHLLQQVTGKLLFVTMMM